MGGTHISDLYMGESTKVTSDHPSMEIHPASGSSLGHDENRWDTDSQKHVHYWMDDELTESVHGYENLLTKARDGSIHDEYENPLTKSRDASTQIKMVSSKESTITSNISCYAVMSDKSDPIGVNGIPMTLK
jgi:hypothetical protein